MNQTESLIARSVPRVVALPARRVRDRDVSAIGPLHVRVDALALCRESVALFAAHSGPVLASALIGYAGISIIAQSFGLLTSVTAGSNGWPYLFFAACGVLLHALAHGALTWIGLQGRDAGEGGQVDAGRDVTLGRHVGRPLRVVLSRWQMLCTGSLLYTLLTFTCAVGCAVLLVRSGLGLSEQGSSYPNPDGMPRLVALRTIDAFLLGPLHPLSELLAPARDNWFLYTWQPASSVPTDLKWLAYRLNALDDSEALARPRALPDWLIALISILLLILTETLLRFRAVAVMRRGRPTCRLASTCQPNSLAPEKCDIFAPLVESARLGLRYFWLVTATTWGLRLAISAIQVTCFVLPVAVADNVILPQLSWIAYAPWISLMSHWACSIGGALLGAILTTFCDLYDVRLFSTLQHAG